MSRRRRTSGTRCRVCQRPIVLLGSPMTDGRTWRAFEPAVVDGRTFTGAGAYPVEGKRAWRVADLVEDLLVRRQGSRADAEDEAYDMPWHVLHVCPPGHDTAPEAPAAEPVDSDTREVRT